MMGRFASFARRLCNDDRGNMVIETAIVAPVLVMLAIGGFDVSRMVARQHELQSGMSEAEAVALAANMGAETNTMTLKTMLKDRLKLNDQQISVVKVFRCNASDTVTTSEPSCDGENDVLSTYLRIEIDNVSYQPMWSKLGISTRLNYDLTRTVQLT